MYGNVLSCLFDKVIEGMRFNLYNKNKLRTGNAKENINTINTIRHLVLKGVRKSYTVL